MIFLIKKNLRVTMNGPLVLDDHARRDLYELRFDDFHNVDDITSKIAFFVYRTTNVLSSRNNTHNEHITYVLSKDDEHSLFTKGPSEWNFNNVNKEELESRFLFHQANDVQTTGFVYDGPLPPLFNNAPTSNIKDFEKITFSHDENTFRLPRKFIGVPWRNLFRCSVIQQKKDGPIAYRAKTSDTSGTNQYGCTLIYEFINEAIPSSAFSDQNFLTQVESFRTPDRYKLIKGQEKARYMNIPWNPRKMAQAALDFDSCSEKVVPHYQVFFKDTRRAPRVAPHLRCQCTEDPISVDAPIRSPAVVSIISKEIELPDYGMNLKCVMEKKVTTREDVCLSCQTLRMWFTMYHDSIKPLVSPPSPEMSQTRSISLSQVFSCSSDEDDDDYVMEEEDEDENESYYMEEEEEEEEKKEEEYDFVPEDQFIPEETQCMILEFLLDSLISDKIRLMWFVGDQESCVTSLVDIWELHRSVAPSGIQVMGAILRGEDTKEDLIENIKWNVHAKPIHKHPAVIEDLDDILTTLSTMSQVCKSWNTRCRKHSIWTMLFQGAHTILSHDMCLHSMCRVTDSYRGRLQLMYMFEHSPRVHGILDSHIFATHTFQRLDSLCALISNALPPGGAEEFMRILQELNFYFEALRLLAFDTYEHWNTRNMNYELKGIYQRSLCKGIIFEALDKCEGVRHLDTFDESSLRKKVEITLRCYA